MNVIPLVKITSLIISITLLAACGVSGYKAPSTESSIAIFEATNNPVMLKITLTVAAGEGDVDSVKMIIDKHPEFRSAKFGNSNTGLLTQTLNTAAGAKVVSLELIDYLIDQGADLNGDIAKVGYDKVISSSLHSAIQGIVIYNVQATTELGRSLAAIQVQTKDNTPASSYEVRLKLIKKLIGAGADVNISTKYNTPLNAALGSNRADPLPEVLELLINAGADTGVIEASLNEHIIKMQRRIEFLDAYL